MPNKIETTLSAINGGDNTAILAEKADIYPYQNGQRTSNDPIGVRLTVILPGYRLSALSVRIEGDDPIPEISNEQLADLCRQRRFTYIELIDCKVSIYSQNARMGMSSVAKSAKIIAKKEK